MITLQILDRTWKAEVLDPDDFHDRFEADEAACALLDTREIYFASDELNLATVIHELVHAYVAGLCLNSASISTHQLEEIMADLFAIHHATIVRQAKALLKELRNA